MTKSFKNAAKGIYSAVGSERNLRIHLAAAFYVVLGLTVTGARAFEWCAALLCAGAVISLELMNTAVEKLCDYVKREFSRDIGRIKDISAGAVLIMSIASAFVGFIIFINEEKIKAAADFFSENPVLTLLIIATIPVSVFFSVGSFTNDKKDGNDNNSGQTERGEIDADKRVNRRKNSDSDE